MEIRSVEDLSSVLESHKTQLDEQGQVVTEATERLKSVIEIADGLKEKAETLETENNTLSEKLADITAFVKGKYKEGTQPEAKMYGFGQYIQAVSEARHGSRVAAEKLADMNVMRIKDIGGNAATDFKSEKLITGGEVKAGLSSVPLTGDNSVGSYYGSYTIPVEYRSELVRVALDNSQMMPLVTRVPVPAITSYLPVTTDELAFTKVTNQNTDKTEDTLTFSRVTLTTEIYAAYLSIVEEFTEDTLVAIGSLVRDMFGEAWGKKFDTLCLSDSTYGAINDSGINTVTMSSGHTSFENLTVDYLNSMPKELDSKAKRNGGRYFLHVTNWDNVEDERDDNGNYVLRMPADPAQLRVKGYPVTLTDGMPDSGDDDTSTKFVAFGNPRYIYNGERVGFEFKIYDQTQSAMESGQIFLRVRTRQAFVLAVPSAWVTLRTAAS